MQQIQDQEQFNLRYLGKVQVKGKQDPVGIHECFSGSTEEEMIIKEKTLPLFNDGMNHYLNRSFASAIKSFQTMTETNPEDLTANFFLDNATRYLQKGVPEDWTGVVEMTIK